MGTSIFNYSSRYSPHTQRKLRERGDNIVVGMLIKENIGGLEEGSIFDKDQEVVHWCVPRSIWEEEVLGEVSVWVRKVSDLRSTKNSDSREEPS